MKAIEVGTFEAKNRLSQLLVMVEKGQRVYITRRGQRIALLTNAADTVSAPGANAPGGDLLQRFRRLRQRASSGPESLRDLVEEGRR